MIGGLGEVRPMHAAAEGGSGCGWLEVLKTQVAILSAPFRVLGARNLTKQSQRRISQHKHMTINDVL